MINNFRLVARLVANEIRRCQFHDDPRVDSFRQQQAGGGVPTVMQPNVADSGSLEQRPPCGSCRCGGADVDSMKLAVLDESEQCRPAVVECSCRFLGGEQ